MVWRPASSPAATARSLALSTIAEAGAPRHVKRPSQPPTELRSVCIAALLPPQLQPCPHPALAIWAVAHSSNRTSYYSPSSPRATEPCVPGDDFLALYAEVAKGADHVVAGKGGAFDTSSTGFATAQRCMRTVDTDRLLWFIERLEGSPNKGSAKVEGPAAVGGGGDMARRCRFGVALRTLDPPSCSPKNSVVLIQPLKSPHSPQSQPQGHPSPPPPPPAQQREDSTCPQTGESRGVAAGDMTADATAGVAGSEFVALFGGHGASGGQMRELRRVATEPQVAALLRHLSNCLEEELERWKEGRRAATAQSVGQRSAHVA